MTLSSILLFALYTCIMLVSSIVLSSVRKRDEATNNERVQNQAIATVNEHFSDAIEEVKLARKEASVARDKHAHLEGRVEELMRQTTEEKQRADSYVEKHVLQDHQISDLKKNMDELKKEQALILKRLSQVEDEKKALEQEKEQLEKTLNTQSEDHQAFMKNVQQRIDEAVENVRVELKAHYETRINELVEQIRQRDKEIAQLKSQLEEKSHEQTNPSTISTDSDSPNPDPQPSDADGSGSNTGSTNPDADTSHVGGDGADTTV